MSEAAEQAFVDELKLSRLQPLECDRSDISVLMLALRSGITLPTLLDQLPGLNPAQLLSAHQRIDRLRERSVQAYQRVLEYPAGATARTYRGAARLFPHVMKLENCSPEDPWATQYRQKCQACIEQLNDLEQRIINPTDRKLPATAALPQVWSQIGYVPARVTPLTSVRITMLLAQ